MEIAGGRQRRALLPALLLLIIPLVMCSCGSDGGSAAPARTRVLFTNGASVSVIQSSDGSYVVQGDNLIGTAGVDLTLHYDTSAASSPTVTQGSLTSGALYLANGNTPGVIRIAVVRLTPFSGSGPISLISFGTQNGNAGISISDIKMIDVAGKSFTPI